MFRFHFRGSCADGTAQGRRKDARTIEKVMGMSFRFCDHRRPAVWCGRDFYTRKADALFYEGRYHHSGRIRYLKIVGFSYLLMSVNMVLSESRCEVWSVSSWAGSLPMRCLCWSKCHRRCHFIFGLLGAPKLRDCRNCGNPHADSFCCIELVNIVLYDRKEYSDVLNVRIRDIFVRDGGLRRDFVLMRCLLRQMG